MGVCAWGVGGWYAVGSQGILKVKEVGLVQDLSHNVLCVFPILDCFSQ